MPSPDFPGSSFANASTGDTDPVAEYNESSYAAPETRYNQDGSEPAKGAMSCLGKKALDIATASDNAIWGSAFSKFTSVYSALKGGNFGMSFQLGKGMFSAKIGVAVPFGALFGAVAGARAGISLMEFADATLSAVGGKGNPLGWHSGSVCVPSNKAGAAAGGGISAFKGKPVTSKSAAQGQLEAWMATGKTVTTAVSSVSMVGDAISGTNMATASINGAMLGGSTSATLGPTMSVASNIGQLGEVSGQLRVQIPAAAGVALGLAKNVYNALYDPSTYEIPGDPGIAGHPESAPAKATPGNDGTTAPTALTDMFFLDNGIMDDAGNINTSNMAAENHSGYGLGRGYNDPGSLAGTGGIMGNDTAAGGAFGAAGNGGFDPSA